MSFKTSVWLVTLFFLMEPGEIQAYYVRIIFLQKLNFWSRILLNKIKVSFFYIQRVRFDRNYEWDVICTAGFMGDADAAVGGLLVEVVRMRRAVYNIHLAHLLLVQIQTRSLAKRSGNKPGKHRIHCLQTKFCMV